MSKTPQELKDAISSNNIDNIKAKTQDLKTILGQIGPEVYRTAAPPTRDGRCSGHNWRYNRARSIKLLEQDRQGELVLREHPPNHNLATVVNDFNEN